MSEALRHRTHGGSLFYEPELDFYFAELDSECGLKSLGVSGVDKVYVDSGRTRRAKAEPDVKVSKQATLSDDLAYSEKNLRAFARGRRVLARLDQLPLFVREFLADYYTPRQWSATERKWNLAEVVAAHLAYRKTK